MTSIYIQAIYKAASQKLGHVKGREYVAAAISSIIFDLEETGGLTPERLEMALKEESELCASASQEVA